MTTPNYKSFYDAIMERLVTSNLYQSSHETNPKQAIRDIIQYELGLDEAYYDLQHD
jgi:hypothetical protein